jgi:hypothetical protein
LVIIETWHGSVEVLVHILEKMALLEKLPFCDHDCPAVASSAAFLF